ncbi:MAG: hypothetical protein KF760_26415 [Candidatus Eremiobacteraeota bacterium]|nr:hypothetical protein [Candidatus Eremiobacteraeota bacterium]MCW5869529.1 hypothetical protein [Candidatus Eremiobacteraeota bacterium]
MALTLLALATIVAVGSLPTCTILSNKGRFQESASLLAQSLLEKQRARPWAELPAPPHYEKLEPITLDGIGQAMDTAMEVYAVGSMDPQKIRRVVVTVSWREKGIPKKLSHETDLVHLTQ